MQELKGLHHCWDVAWSLLGHTAQCADTRHQINTAHTHTHTHMSTHTHTHIHTHTQRERERERERERDEGQQHQ